MKIGFIGLGNVGAKLAGSLLRNGFDLTVKDVDQNITDQFKNLGAKVANSGKELAEQVDLIITSLPSLKVSAEVMEAKDGVLEGISKNKIWLEMSTSDEAEVRRIGKKVIAKNALPLDGPVSGGCHRAATGNIAIFVGGERKAFEKILPVLTVMGRKVLHTGELGTASTLKVITNKTDQLITHLPLVIDLFYLVSYHNQFLLQSDIHLVKSCLSILYDKVSKHKFLFYPLHLLDSKILVAYELSFH